MAQPWTTLPPRWTIEPEVEPRPPGGGWPVSSSNSRRPTSISASSPFDEALRERPDSLVATPEQRPAGVAEQHLEAVARTAEEEDSGAHPVVRHRHSVAPKYPAPRTSSRLAEVARPRTMAVGCPFLARSAARVAALALILGSGLGLAMPGLVAADDPGAVPSPTPVVFHNPQYLVWMDGHGTYNGPVEDNAYWLYISPPTPTATSSSPTGAAASTTTPGHLVGGPFTRRDGRLPGDALAGVASLQAWATAAGE